MRISWLFFIGASVGIMAPASALTIKDRPSPKNRTLPRRASTDFIILHTTEGSRKGALYKLRKNGQAHYLVSRKGIVYRIVDKDLVANHAGRSMWNGVEHLDRRAVGIEVVGYHNKKPRAAQLAALKTLIAELQSIYNVPDDHVFTHSMVAYGTPNRYHRYRHRGRKRCAMNLADPKIRLALGLTEAPAYDPDVAAKRLRVADKKLYKRLFPGNRKPKKVSESSLLTALAKILPIEKKVPIRNDAALAPSKEEASPTPKAKSAPKEPVVAQTELKTQASPPSAAAEPALKKTRAQPVQLTSVSPSRTKSNRRCTRCDRSASTRRSTVRGRTKSRRTASRSGITTLRRRSPAHAVVGRNAESSRTIYLFPDGMVRTGSALAQSPHQRRLRRLPSGTRIVTGRRYGGYVKPSRAPSEICGSDWNHPETLYRLPSGKLVDGNDIRPAKIPRSTMVFCRS